MGTLVFNRPSDNFLFHGSQFKAGNTVNKLRLSSSAQQSVIDICNTGYIDISAIEVLINGAPIVTSNPNNPGTTTISNLNVSSHTTLQGVSAGTMSISGSLNNAGSTSLGGAVGISGATVIQNTFNVIDATTLNTLTTSGATNLQNTLSVSGNTVLGNNLNVNNNSGTSVFKVNTSTNTTTIGGPTSLGSTLGVTGATTLGNTLNVTNATNLSTLTATGGTVLQSTLGVSGSTTLGGATNVTNVFNVTDATTLNSLTAGGNTTLQQALSVSGATTMGNNLNVNNGTGTSVFKVNTSTNTTTIGGPASLGSTLGVTGATTLGNTLNVTNATNLSTLTATGGTVLQSTLGVSGGTTLGGATNVTNVFNVTDATTLNSLTTSGNTTLQQALSVSGATTMGNNLFVNNGSGTSVFKVNTSTNTTTIGGPATIGSTLGVTGVTTMGNNLNVNNSTGTSVFKVNTASNTTTIGGPATIGGAASLSSTLGVTGNTTLGGTTTIAGATSVNSTFNVTGNTTLGSTFEVAGAAEFKDTVLVQEAATFNKNLTANGASTSISLGGTNSTIALAGSALTSSIASTYSADNTFNRNFTHNMTTAGGTTFTKARFETGLVISSNLTPDAEFAVYGKSDFHNNVVFKNPVTMEDEIICDDIKSTGNMDLSKNLNIEGEINIGLGNRGGKIYGTTTNNEIVIDPFPLDGVTDTDASGVVTILGDLIVRGTTTTIHSSEISIADKVFTIAQGSVSAGTASGAGIRIDSDIATFLYDSANNGKWITNVGLSVSGDVTVADTLTVDSTTELKDTLTLSKSSGVGLNVVSDASFDNNVSIDGKLFANANIEFTGDLLPATNSSNIPVGYSSFEAVTGGLAAIIGNTSGTFENCPGYEIAKNILSQHSYVKLEFKVNFTSSKEAGQTLSFRVLRSTDGGNTYDTTPVFTDEKLGSEMGVGVRNVYNGTFIDKPNGTNLKYKLQLQRNDDDSNGIDVDFGIVTGGNYIYMQELYRPTA